MGSKYILFTFDYELFLGSRSGSVKDCLLFPTEQIRIFLNKYALKAVFFVDTTYMWRLKNESNHSVNCRKNYELIVEQLYRLKNDGHTIYHHLHPHWLHALYLDEIDQWDLSETSHYSFSQLHTDEKASLMHFSSTFIQQFEGSQATGFRAGGLYIDPIQDFIPYFKKHSILYDFSVVPNDFSFADNLSYDFRGLPLQPYTFEQSIRFATKKGEFMEFPITRFTLSGISKLLNGVYHRLFVSPNEEMVGKPAKLASLQKPVNTALKMNLPLSIEFLNAFNKYYCLSVLKKEPYIQFLSHPKLINDKHIKALEYMVGKLNNEFDLVSDFHAVKKEFSTNL